MIGLKSKSSVVDGLSRLSHEHLEDRVICFFGITISQLSQESVEVILLTLRALDTSQDLANIATVVSVMEQRDVKARL
jgi:uncharacterized SAM-dependent methyltransferase